MIVFNDVSLIPYYIIMILFFLFVLYTSLITHELGHALYFLIALKKKIRIRWGLLKTYAGDQEDYDNLTDEQYIKVNSWGIMLGASPIILLSLIMPITWLMLFPYILAVRSDIQNVLEYTKDED